MVREIEVRDLNGNQIKWISDMEIINYNVPACNYIFANEFQTNFIHMIRIADGQVVKTWNMEELLMLEYDKHWHQNTLGPWTDGLENPHHGWKQAVFNGLSYLYYSDSFLMTGREWDTIYQVKLDYHKYMDKLY